MWPCVAASLDGRSGPSTSSPWRSQTTIASGSRSAYGTPLALMTISSSPGTRADRLPAVHATRPLRGSSMCSAHTSRRSASVTDQLPRAQLAQPVHHVVATAAEVVVQLRVVRVERVVGVGPALVRHERVAPH